MTRFLLATSALVTLRDDEPGVKRVAEVLAPARSAGTAATQSQENVSTIAALKHPA